MPPLPPVTSAVLPLKSTYLTLPGAAPRSRQRRVKDDLGASHCMHRRTQDLRRLQLAWACAAVGGWMFMVALAVHAYAAGGATAVGLAALVRMLPAGLAAPLLGHAGGRFGRRDVRTAPALARALVVVGAALALDSLPAVLVLAAVFTTLTSAHKPAQAALLPTLTANPIGANAVWSGIDNASFVVGALAA